MSDMERLTIDEVIVRCNRLVEQLELMFSREKWENRDLDFSFTKEYWEHRQVAEWLIELQRYRDLAEQGRLVELPCGIGADVYVIPSKMDFEWNVIFNHPEYNRVKHRKVNGICFNSHGFYMHCDTSNFVLVDKMYKKTWFLSKAEAEAKLKELEGGENG